MGGEGSSVEGGVTEEEVGRCELNQGGRNTTQGHGVWKTMVRNEILKKPRRMLDREGGASCGTHRLPSCPPALGNTLSHPGPGRMTWFLGHHEL